MRRSVLAAAGLFLLPHLQATNTIQPLSCPAGVLIADVNLSVRPSSNSPDRPLRSVNLLLPGYSILYTPNNSPGGISKKAEVAVVLVPSDESKLVVLDPKPAAHPADWLVPTRAAVVALIYGPQGLNEKKINNVDTHLIAQLADYADKTTQTEALLGALMQYDKSESGSEHLNAALTGFASRFGVANTRIDRTKGLDEQAGVLLGTLNPALSSYDPLAPQQTVRLQQSASLAASVAALFFGNAVGLAAGGTSMLLNLRTLMFPNVEFRSSFAQVSPGQNLTLCARPEARSRTRIGYLWATRLPNMAAPSASLASPAHVGIGVKTKIPLSAELPILSRASNWTLRSSDTAVPVRVLTLGKELELDLTRFAGAVGEYRLQAEWDWDPLPIGGRVNVYAIPKLANARLNPLSQDGLVERRGPIPVQLQGEDFQFVQRLSLKTTSTLRPVTIDLPIGPREPGPQPTLTTEIDTSQLGAGQYVLAMSQSGNVQRDIPVRVLPPTPVLSNLPLRVNVGEKLQTVEIQGIGLDRMERVTAASAETALIRAKGKTVLQVRLPETAARGDRMDLAVFVEGLTAPVRLSGALEVVGPRPRIRSVSSSVPENLGVTLRDNELPAGSFTTFSLLVEPLSSQPWVNLRCADKAQTLRPVHLRAGEQNPSVKLEQSSSTSLYLSVDPASIGSVSCRLTASIETELEGASDPELLGRIVNLPRIETFELTPESLGESLYSGLLKGHDLETIEKAGWNATEGFPVRGLPAPIAREGAKQMLKIALPWPPPAPKSPVYIWLRGEKTGRSTEARY